MMQKDTSVPRGTIEMFGFESRIRLSDCQYWSIVPSGTDTSLKTLTQHLVLGYFRQVPTGLIFTEFPTTCAILIATCYIHAHVRLPERSRRYFQTVSFRIVSPTRTVPGMTILALRPRSRSSRPIGEFTNRRASGPNRCANLLQPR
jgi:hypothetical protein